MKVICAELRRVGPAMARPRGQVLRVLRANADLAGEADIRAGHLSGAINHWRLDRQLWRPSVGPKERGFAVGRWGITSVLPCRFHQ